MPPTPELTEPQTVEEMPILVRRIFFIAAIGSIGLALLAAHMVRPGIDELFKEHDGAMLPALFEHLDFAGHKTSGFAGQRDKALIYMAGLPVALCALIAAIQGWSGLPKKPARVCAAIGLALSLTVLFGAGIPALLDYLKNT